MMKRLSMLAGLLALGACGTPHPSHPIVYPPPQPPQVGEVPPHPAHPIVYPPPQPPQVGEPPQVIPPHPAHPIVYPHSELYFLLHGYSIKDVWASIPCETATDGSEYCGYIPIPHPEQLPQ